MSDIEPADHARQLGRMIANFANLELYIAWIAHLLIGRDQVVGRTVTATMSFRNTTAVVGALARHLVHGPILDELLGILKRAVALEEKRNAFAHSAWMRASDPEEQAPGTVGRLKFRVSLKQGYVEHYEDLPVAEIETVANDTKALMEEIMGWLEKAGAVNEELRFRMSEPSEE